MTLFQIYLNTIGHTCGVVRPVVGNANHTQLIIYNVGSKGLKVLYISTNKFDKLSKNKYFSTSAILIKISSTKQQSRTLK